MDDKMRATGPNREILLLAKEFIAGKAGVIQTARALAPLRHDADSEVNELLLTFTGIDSVTDTLPVGHVRSYWAPGALEQKDREIARTEDFYREAAVNAATRLIRLLDDPR
jgi:hypothetical protein